MITYVQAIIIGVLQGITELFPVSSLGHSVILPSLLGWNIDQGANFFLIFLVATHLATALVLLGFFYKDWLRILTNKKLLALLIIATIPAGLLGLLLESKLKHLFASPITVSMFLILNGVVLYGAELLRKRGGLKTINELSWIQSFKVGCAQALALIPGFSRTGTTLGGGLLVGLNHEDAARFSFLLATPIILAAGALKLPQLFTTDARLEMGPIIAGVIAAAIGAYFSVRFLTSYFKTKTLTPFAIYCVVAGLGSLIILLVR